MATTITLGDLIKDKKLETIKTTEDPILSTGQGIIDSAISGVTNAQSEVDKLNKEQADRLALLGEKSTELGGKAAYTAEQSKLFGLDTEKANYDKYSQELNDITANIKGLSREAQAIPIQVQEKFKNTGATDRGVAPIEAGRLRENAIKALTQASLADIVTANINNSVIRYNAAIDKVNQAVALKYEPIETEIANLKEQLQLNRDYLQTPAEKKLADYQLKILNERERKLTEQKAEEQAVNNIRIEIAKNNPSKVSRLDGVTTINDALAKVGDALVTSQNDIVKLNDGSTILVDRKTGKIIKNFGGGDSTGDIPTSIVQTVQTSSGAEAVNGYTLQAGDDPYFIAQTNGTDMATLERLNPNIKDWRNLPVGAVINLPNTSETWLKGKTAQQIQAYNSLPDVDKASIKQLVNGDALLADIVKSRGISGTAKIQKLINQATAIDPNFSVNKNKIVYNANNQWNNPNGKAFLTRSSMNTAMSHMALTYETAKTLGNTKIPKYNEVSNWISKNTGNPALTNFIYDLTALAGEVASAYKNGTAPTEKEKEDFFNTMSGNMSPAQLKGVFTQSTALMAGKLKSLAQEYKQSTGKYPTDPIIQPSVLSEMYKAGIDTSPVNNILHEQGYDVPKEVGGTDNFLMQFTPQGLESSLNNSDFFNQFEF